MLTFIVFRIVDIGRDSRYDITMIPAEVVKVSV